MKNALILIVTFSYISASFLCMIKTICYMKPLLEKKDNGVSGHQILFVKDSILTPEGLAGFLEKRTEVVLGILSDLLQPNPIIWAYLSLSHRWTTGVNLSNIFQQLEKSTNRLTDILSYDKLASFTSWIISNSSIWTMQFNKENFVLFKICIRNSGMSFLPAFLWHHRVVPFVQLKRRLFYFYGRTDVKMPDLLHRAPLQ